VVYYKISRNVDIPDFRGVISSLKHLKTNVGEQKNSYPFHAHVVSRERIKAARGHAQWEWPSQPFPGSYAYSVLFGQRRIGAAANVEDGVSSRSAPKM
jgi:hypothetical protein